MKKIAYNFELWVYDSVNICASLILFGIRHKFVVLISKASLKNVELESHRLLRMNTYNIFDIAARFATSITKWIASNVSFQHLTVLCATEAEITT